ncbi:hypothetical protein J4232_03135 [Candidatus Woesearchaeota archaeon]|nr:hypothetical protein [Candidatus Woesearchaeota archaeon]
MKKNIILFTVVVIISLVIITTTIKSVAAVEINKVKAETDISKKTITVTTTGNYYAAIYAAKTGYSSPQKIQTVEKAKTVSIGMDKIEAILCGTKICGNKVVTIKYGLSSTNLDKSFELNVDNCFSFDTSINNNNKNSCSITIKTDGSIGSYCNNNNYKCIGSNVCNTKTTICEETKDKIIASVDEKAKKVYVTLSGKNNIAKVVVNNIVKATLSKTSSQISLLKETALDTSIICGDLLCKDKTIDIKYGAAENSLQTITLKNSNCFEYDTSKTTNDKASCSKTIATDGSEGAYCGTIYVCASGFTCDSASKTCKKKASGIGGLLSGIGSSIIDTVFGIGCTKNSDCKTGEYCELSSNKCIVKSTVNAYIDITTKKVIIETIGDYAAAVYQNSNKLKDIGKAKKEEILLSSTNLLCEEKICDDKSLTIKYGLQNNLNSQFYLDNIDCFDYTTDKSEALNKKTSCSKIIKVDGSVDAYCDGINYICSTTNQCNTITKNCEVKPSSPASNTADKLTITVDLKTNKIILNLNGKTNYVQLYDWQNTLQKIVTKTSSQAASTKEEALTNFKILCGDKICDNKLIYIKYGESTSSSLKTITLNKDNCFDYDTSYTSSANTKSSCTNTIKTDGNLGAFCGTGYSCNLGFECDTSSNICKIKTTPLEICDNQKDDDKDQYVDCEDTDCSGFVYSKTDTISGTNQKMDIMCAGKIGNTCGEIDYFAPGNKYGSVIDTGKFDMLCTKNGIYNTWYESNTDNKQEKLGSNGITSTKGTIILAGGCEYISAGFPANNPQYESWVGCNCNFGPNGVKAKPGDNYEGYQCSSGKWKKLVAEESCFDGIQAQNEQGIDCGGICQNKCIGCTDGIKNQGETGIDCGGPCANKCGSCTDGIVNQNKEGIDCGEVCPNKCGCTDTEIGKDYYTKGSIVYNGLTTAADGTPLEDACDKTNPNQLIEYFCDKDAQNKPIYKYEIHNCLSSEICKDGSCIKPQLTPTEIKCAKQIQKPDAQIMKYDVCKEEKDCNFAGYSCDTNSKCIIGCNNDKDCLSNKVCDAITKSCINKVCTEAAPSTVCVDTDKTSAADDGIEWYAKGEAKKDNGVALKDKCIDKSYKEVAESDSLYEAYCDINGDAKYINIPCKVTDICKNGICTPKAGKACAKDNDCKIDESCSNKACVKKSIHATVDLNTKELFVEITGQLQADIITDEKTNQAIGISTALSPYKTSTNGIKTITLCDNKLCTDSKVILKSDMNKDDDTTDPNEVIILDKLNCFQYNTLLTTEQNLKYSCDKVKKQNVCGEINADFVYIALEKVAVSNGDNTKLIISPVGNYDSFSYTWTFGGAGSTLPLINKSKAPTFTTKRTDYPNNITLTVNIDEQIQQLTKEVNIKCTSEDYCKAGYHCSLETGRCEKNYVSLQSCTIAKCKLTGYYCQNPGKKICVLGCDENNDCKHGSNCNLKQNKCVTTTPVPCSKLDDCAGNTVCNLKTNKCETKNNVQIACAWDNTVACIYAGTYCYVDDLGGTCKAGCDNDNDCKNYQKCNIQGASGTCIDKTPDATAEFTYEQSMNGNQIYIYASPKNKQYYASSYSWTVGSSPPNMKTIAKFQEFNLNKDIFPTNLTLTLTVDGNIKQSTQEINVNCDSSDYCKSGYACDFTTNNCNKISSPLPACASTAIIQCQFNEQCVQLNSTTKQFECYDKNQVIEYDYVNASGGVEKREIECSVQNTWCMKNFDYDLFSKACSPTTEACYIPPFDEYCGPDSQLTKGWFTDKKKSTGQLACFIKSEIKDQACCLAQTINNIYYYEYADIKVY